MVGGEIVLNDITKTCIQGAVFNVVHHGYAKGLGKPKGRTTVGNDSFIE